MGQTDKLYCANPLSARADALAALFCSLAWLFSYPDRAQAETFTSLEFLKNCETLLDRALIENAKLTETAQLFKEATRVKGDERAQILRVEYTRLFITAPRLVCLEGSRWVKRSRTLLSQRKGEKFAVEQQYRELGLINQSGTKDPSDHLVSELDFAAYVTTAEARAWEGDDAASAREWKLVRDEFLNSHLSELGLAVADEVEHLTSNAYIAFYASMLRAVILSCL